MIIYNGVAFLPFISGAQVGVYHGFIYMSPDGVLGYVWLGVFFACLHAQDVRRYPRAYRTQ